MSVSVSKDTEYGTVQVYLKHAEEYRIIFVIFRDADTYTNFSYRHIFACACIYLYMHDTQMLASPDACMHTYIYIQVHTYIRGYIHTYIHTQYYTPAILHTYTHTHICIHYILGCM